jgi:hypothetical protein
MLFVLRTEPFSRPVSSAHRKSSFASISAAMRYPSLAHETIAIKNSSRRRAVRFAHFELFLKGFLVVPSSSAASSQSLKHHQRLRQTRCGGHVIRYVVAFRDDLGRLNVRLYLDAES